MEEIIQAVDRKLLKSELTPDKFLRKTNKGGNEIYITTAKDSPNIMLELARLRELSFRSAGGGSGKSLDMDEFDTMECPYKQLFVWDPDSEEIIGGYRYIMANDIKLSENGQPHLATAEMYYFTDNFIKNYLPYMIELGRSFVQPDYQSSKKGAKSLFALDNIWDGLGALLVKNPNLKYFFGKVTVYQHYNSTARDMIFGFLRKYFPDHENLVYPVDPFEISFTPKQIDNLFNAPTYKENFHILNREVRALGVNIPPLVNAYMGLSPNMSSFGFAVYHEFGELIECCIMIPIDQMYEEKKQRHITTFLEGPENKTV
ncbi:MAG: hypothetical protein BWY47_00833 [Bacteroidetes bacterium ADurb.Bin302]|jgi:hypothetical protein|nr:MAG: hypothetical protein BWY47_00833 [Bacteroidetes bacterium ADurb.Bin302]HPG55471.1 GNAT family N-acetyltransferase [Candidatus Enterocola sp.]